MPDLGFPYQLRYHFRINGRSFRVTSEGMAVLALLLELYRASLTAEDGYWALPWREQIRQVEQLAGRALLTQVIEKTPDARLRLLAIWMRGRCGGYIGTSVVANCAHSPNFKRQKESIRALKRLSAWAHLREIAGSTRDPRLRNLAKQNSPRPLADRLSNALANFQRITPVSQRSALWQAPGLRLYLTPPKTVEMIRRLLTRIASAVSRSQP